jgi:hypothetical protein
VPDYSQRSYIYISHASLSSVCYYLIQKHLESVSHSRLTHQYVFGMHVDSDEYAKPALMQLSFMSHNNGDNISNNDNLVPFTATASSAKQTGAETVKTASSVPKENTTDNEDVEHDEEVQGMVVKVVYRNKSEFFYSTCRAAINEAHALGFSTVEAIEYDPEGDHDGDGIPNSEDDEFIQSLANQVCPPHTSNTNNPAIFACLTANEMDTFLQQLRSNRCQPSMLWSTTSTWDWANENIGAVPYIMGGSQWHKNFDYADNYFESGQNLLSHNQRKFGYQGNYDTVVSYAIAMLYASHLQAFFRVVDEPDVEDAFLNRYEELRRNLVVLNADTLFGPVVFNQNQRNMGRGSAASQWLPYNDSGWGSSSGGARTRNGNGGTPTTTGGTELSTSSFSYFAACVSPLSQAQAITVIPAPIAVPCEAGLFVNGSAIEMQPSLLTDKCSACPVDTYNPSFSIDQQHCEHCLPCPLGSTTIGRSGATQCIAHNPQMLSLSVRIVGLILVIIVWLSAAGCLKWLIKFRNDPVVKIGQIQFLVIICVGAVISSSSMLAFGAEAGIGESTRLADIGCRAAPFLYNIGWVLQYSSLTAKTFRLYKLVGENFRRRIVTAANMYYIIAGSLFCDLAILVAWIVVDPLTYVRVPTGTLVNEDGSVLVMESVGRCQSQKYPVWYWVVPIMTLHACLMISTNYLLYKVRNVAARYQEQKVGLASLIVLEVLLVGIPMSLAVQQNPTATYIAFLGIVFLNDAGILGCIFLPKVMYQRKGLPTGQTVLQSVVPNRSQAPTNRGSTLPCASAHGAPRSDDSVWMCGASVHGAPRRHSGWFPDNADRLSASSIGGLPGSTYSLSWSRAHRRRSIQGPSMHGAPSPISPIIGPSRNDTSSKSKPTVPQSLTDKTSSKPATTDAHTSGVAASPKEAQTKAEDPQSFPACSLPSSLPRATRPNTPTTMFGTSRRNSAQHSVSSWVTSDEHGDSGVLDKLAPHCNENNV